VAEMPLDSTADTPLRLRIVFEDAIIEAFLDDRYSLVARSAHPLPGSRVILFADGFPVRFLDLGLFQFNAFN
jgi:hypothetical protein